MGLTKLSGLIGLDKINKTKSSKLSGFLCSFGEGKEDIKELIDRIARKIPYEEKLSTTVSELMDEKF